MRNVQVEFLFKGANLVTFEVVNIFSDLMYKFLKTLL